MYICYHIVVVTCIVDLLYRNKSINQTVWSVKQVYVIVVFTDHTNHHFYVPVNKFPVMSGHCFVGPVLSTKVIASHSSLLKGLNPLALCQQVQRFDAPILFLGYYHLAIVVGGQTS